MIIIDGNRFVTTEGAQSFYLERRTTHIGDWDIWLIKQDEYSIHLAVPPDSSRIQKHSQKKRKKLMKICSTKATTSARECMK